MTEPKKNAAIITGAAQKVGRATAIFLASKHKYDIVAHYNKSHESALELKKTIQEKIGQKCVIVQADLQDSHHLEHIISHAFSEIPHCNVLINNASLFYEDDLRNCTIENFRDNFNIHVLAPVFLTKHFARLCIDKGKIINVIDTNITRYRTKYFSYLLSKKSLADFTKMAAENLFPNICVNAICPTKIPSHEIKDIDCIYNMAAQSPLRRFLEAAELLLDTNTSRNGEILHVQ